ncbi:Guanine nucleotide exchange factor lte1 [Microsporum canis]|uniref:Low temperature essential 1 n=1 Tax=Arthroderma otae (strain ATCC MYA-4605 / CBS 113480) TaxID=554155 RepID=C5FCJ0_ARTOC|nr:low temperature essential 1 [Microsporum canis CBS 113480]EEQ27434.1 low temperature essential 1 [Microsporum canis CBS 113480]
MNTNSSSYSAFGPRRHSVAKSQNIHSQGPSLREVKSSDEVLAHRRRGASHGRQFTVANVGNNGRLYLRPIANRPYALQTLQPSPNIAETTTDHRASAWSNSQFSYLVDQPDTTSRGPALAYHHLRRWKSLPTIDDVPPSPTRGALKVVIEGSEPVDKTPPKLPGPARKLDDFRFPDRHASAYRPAPRTPRLSSPISMAKMDNKSVDKAIGQSVFYKLMEPIEPSIFDDLIPIMHDASVVRYAKQTKQLSAATPARIVAQISSESFMDYELVSDFFLTFRSYLSPGNLLSLLLARLQWAINRREDDGRIIRIRVFAALRHWILNYFVDDFVANDGLRAQFCSRINSLYEDLKCRSSRDVSDTKIILDLKRCWNGRCAQYWDDPEFVNDARPDDPIVPGANKPDSRPNGDGLCFSYSELVAQDAPASYNRKGSAASVNDFPKSPPPASSAFSPPSVNMPSSRLSMRNNSLSNQGRTAHHPPDPIPELNDPSRSPASPSLRSPTWRWPLHSHSQSSHSHKRSGSFSDSFRDDRAPLPHSQSNLNIDSSGGGLTSLSQLTVETTNSPGVNFSIIRGSMLAPLEPDVPTTRPPSPPPDPSMPRLRPPSSPSFSSSTSAAASFARTDSPPKSPAPAVKTFISSLRRVLHGSSSIASASSASGISNKPEPRPIVSAYGKTSLLPPNVVFGSDKYREKRPGIKSASRIDVLCDRAYQSYRALAIQTPVATPTVVARSPSPKSQPRAEMPASLPIPNYSRGVSSQITAGSQSIVIVDDTGARVGTGGGLSLLPEEFQMYYPGSGQSEPEPEIDPLTPIPMQIPQKDKLEVTPISTHENVTINKPGSRLRKYASYQSVLGGHGAQRPVSDMPKVTAHVDMAASRDSFLPVHMPAARPLQLPEKRLRRRPGGDLRKMQNTVDSVEQRPNINHDRGLTTLKFASGTTATNSTSSALYIPPASVNMGSGSHSEDDNYDDDDEIDFSTSSSALDSLSRSDTRSYSSPQPRGRHIFEDAVAGFRKIPDQADGGIESALLKLEGRWGEGMGSGVNDSPQKAAFSNTGRRRSRHARHDGLTHGQYLNVRNDTTAYPGSSDAAIPTGTESYLGSDYSYSSIPLLERGLGDESMKTPQLPKSENPSPLGQGALSHPSIEVIEKTDSMNRIAQGATAAEPVHENADDNISELSSELSIDEESSRGASHPTHPLAAPSVPISFLPPASLPPYNHYGCPPYANQHHDTHPNFSRPRNNSQPSLTPTTPTHSGSTFPSSGHIAFVLAHDSQTLAKQFTIVEQAALGEVDWKDLVDMRWAHSCPSPLNWVDYLSAGLDRKGIDMVIARFNLMVKWAVSEIVLTKNISERALVITKLIHISVNARKLRNYATMLQIVIALSSVDCTRLAKTWERVPETEKGILAEMESLIQPTRNFHKLRSEMESSVQDGCIPFVGLYVQDLTYNAQKPAQIASTRDGEPLVNFERYHTAAAIVKSLLRLIDASTKYTFEPVPGVLERCLWIAALADDDIKAFSKAIE